MQKLQKTPVKSMEAESDEYENPSSDESAAESDDASDNEVETASGWANQMAKILRKQKPKNKKSLILSKTKKLSEIKPVPGKEYNFQIDGEEVKEEKPDDIELKEEQIKYETKIVERKVKAVSFRIKQKLFDRDREKTLKKVATKGVVQLFNAVKMQQKDISQKLKEAGPLDHRRERVLNSLDKRAFLDVLQKGRRGKSELIDNPVKKEDDDDDDDEDDYEHDDKPKKETWGIFKQDFLTNKKLSNWDQNEEDNEDKMQTDDDDDGDFSS